MILLATDAQEGAIQIVRHVLQIFSLNRAPVSHARLAVINVTSVQERIPIIANSVQVVKNKSLEALRQIQNIVKIHAYRATMKILRTMFVEVTILDKIVI